MAQPPAYPQTPPEPQAIPPKKSNTVLWVVLIIGLGALCIGVLIVAAVLFPVFSQARFAAQNTQCRSSVKQWTAAAMMYAGDFDDRLPKADRWMDAVESYMSEFKSCPIVYKETGPQAYGYGFNDALSEIATSKIKEPDRTVMIFESKGTGKNAHGNEDELVLPGRHGTGSKAGSNYGFAGGNAKFVLDTARADLWKP